MVQDAEKFAEEDQKTKGKVDARNEVEGYAYNLKNQVADKEKLGGKLSDEDKEAINKAVDETIAWLDANAEAEKEELEKQKKKLEEVAQPIVSKIYPNNEGGSAETAEEPEDSADE